MRVERRVWLDASQRRIPRRDRLAVVAMEDLLAALGSVACLGVVGANPGLETRDWTDDILWLLRWVALEGDAELGVLGGTPVTVAGDVGLGDVVGPTEALAWTAARRRRGRRGACR